MWYQNLNIFTILVAFLIFIASFAFFKAIFSSRRLLGHILSALFIGVFLLLFKIFHLPYENEVLLYGNIFVWGVVLIISVPDIRDVIDTLSYTQIQKKVLMGSEKTKNSIALAAEYFSKERIGALITIEKDNRLDQFSEKAITLDSEVSMEILVNIFIPNTPLHDGAVIIRGDRIVCAGAYFVLSNNETFNKSTTGSRHRAGLGISEVTDSLTVIVSEETGHISIAIDGIMLEMNSKEKLLEYLTTFMR